MVPGISQEKNAHVSSEYVHGIGPFLHFSGKKKKKKAGGGGKALNSLAIKQAMPARNAGMGDCSAAHPSISARLRVCVSTMHVLPRALTPHAGPNGRCANGRQVSVARSQRCSQARCPCVSRIPFFCLCLASQKPRSFPSYSLGNPQSE